MSISFAHVLWVSETVSLDSAKESKSNDDPSSDSTFIASKSSSYFSITSATPDAWMILAQAA